MTKKELINQIKELCRAFDIQSTIIREINAELNKIGIQWAEAFEVTRWRSAGKSTFKLYLIANTEWRQKKTRIQDLLDLILNGHKELNEMCYVENRGWELLGY